MEEIITGGLTSVQKPSAPTGIALWAQLLLPVPAAVAFDFFVAWVFSGGGHLDPIEVTQSEYFRYAISGLIGGLMGSIGYRRGDVVWEYFRVTEEGINPGVFGDLIMGSGVSLIASAIAIPFALQDNAAVFLITMGLAVAPKPFIRMNFKRSAKAMGLTNPSPSKTKK